MRVICNHGPSLHSFPTPFYLLIPFRRSSPLSWNVCGSSAWRNLVGTMYPDVSATRVVIVAWYPNVARRWCYNNYFVRWHGWPRGNQITCASCEQLRSSDQCHNCEYILQSFHNAFCLFFVSKYRMQHSRIDNRCFR